VQAALVDGAAHGNGGDVPRMTRSQDPARDFAPVRNQHLVVEEGPLLLQSCGNANIIIAAAAASGSSTTTTRRRRHASKAKLRRSMR
jgi:hypothetical protein